MDLRDKVVVITGGANGIGLEAVRQMARRGAKINVIDSDKDALTKLARELPDCATFHADLTDLDTIPSLVNMISSNTPRVDVLINNAGIGCHGPLEEMRLHDIDYVMKLNITSPAILIKLFRPRLNPGGVIINVGSPVAAYATKGFSLYSGSKNAIKSVSYIVRKELAGANIRLVLFYPFITWSSYARNAIYTPSFEPWTKKNLPAWPDTAQFAAKRLVDAIGSRKRIVKARPDWYFFFAVIKQKLYVSKK